MPLLKCTRANGCTKEAAAITLDANWRWLHNVGGYQNCYEDTDWNPTFCPDPATCAQRCALEGVTAQQYESSYGIKPYPGGVELKFVTTHRYGENYGSRVYMMDSPSSDNYKLFHLKNREFTLDVDVSALPCGLNGAVYFVEMDQSGGKGGTNQAGAKYGTGYCDAQCPHDVKFIDGEANLLQWQSQHRPPIGHYGSCCAELDIWEANSRATAFTPHPCSIEGPRRCEGTSCGDNDSGERYSGVCDKDGCDFNSHRLGEKAFFGHNSGFEVDSSRPLKLVTQFLTSDGTDTGDLVEIRRFYMQDGQLVPNSNSTILGAQSSNSITDNFCQQQKSAFNDPNDFAAKGALRNMGVAMDRGMVLVLSLWDDIEANMLWLDSKYPVNASASTPGVERGPCAGGAASTPEYLRRTYPHASVKFWNAAVGEIGSTTSSARRLASTPLHI